MSTPSNTSSVKLAKGVVYTGLVMTTNPTTQTFEIKEDETGAIIPAVWAGNIMCGLFGVRSTYTPAVGSKVLFTVNRDRGFALGSSASDRPFLSHLETSSGDKADRTKNYKMYPESDGYSQDGHNPARDLLEGEFEIGNVMGVGVQFLNSLVKMQAGDLAKVEVSLLNDMVRVVSQTFRHFNALGNYEIYNDGRLNARWTGTSYDHELWGKETANEVKEDVQDAEIDLTSVSRLEDTLRARFSQFIGHLGSFINIYVTDPGTALGQIAQDAGDDDPASKYRSGKFRAHVGNDGTLLVQSVSEIVLERVVRIPVPHEEKRWDDPAGNKPEDYNSADLNFLKKWKYDPDPKNMWYSAYQLRSYARWLSSMYSLARYRQMTKDWKVPSEMQTPAPDMNNVEEDRERVDPGKETDYVETYATIRIMRDGSIVQMDGTGSSVVMANGNLQLSAAKNLTLEAAGDINLVAGNDVNVKARRNIQIAAVVGGLTLKARTWFHNFCEWGTYWVRSGAKDSRREGVDPDTPVNSETDPDPVVLEHAVLIQATQGRIAEESVNGHRIVTKRRNVAPESVKVEVFSESNFEVTTRENLDLVAQKDVRIKARYCLTYLRKWINDVLSVFSIGKNFQVRANGSKVDAQSIAAQRLSAPNVYADTRQAGFPSHPGHIGNMPEGDSRQQFVGQPVDNEDLELALSVRELGLQVIAPASGNGDIKPGFYGTYDSDNLVESNTQQEIKKLYPDPDGPYGLWNWSSDRLRDTEVDSNKSMPWPGSSQILVFSHTAQSLGTPSSSTVFENSAPAPEKSGAQFRFVKR